MRAAVVGLGTMGPGLAATLARGGMEVNAFDVSADQRAKAPGLMQQATGVLSALAVPDKSSGKLPTVTETIAEACKGADLVVETVPEKLEIKAAVFKEIDGLVGKKCVIASNTSGIPITKLQAKISNPDRVVGMHWSNPAHVIPFDTHCPRLAWIRDVTIFTVTRSRGVRFCLARASHASFEGAQDPRETPSAMPMPESGRDWYRLSVGEA